MTKQEYGSELRLQAAQIINYNGFSNTSTDGIDKSISNRQKLKLQFKGGGARLGFQLKKLVELQDEDS